jgi:hypothetical protein
MPKRIVGSPYTFVQPWTKLVQTFEPEEHTVWRVCRGRDSTLVREFADQKQADDLAVLLNEAYDTGYETSQANITFPTRRKTTAQKFFPDLP